ncbi:MAG TPA: pentapeptide repeat-containing protein, partial [Pyrinomonadaceae bacterium]
MNPSRTNLYILVGIIVFAALFSALIFIPRWQASIYERKVTEHINNISDAKDRAAAIKDIELYENSARLTIAQIVGGLVLLAGLYFTYQNVVAAQNNAKTAQENLRITEEGKLTDRFSKAVEMLGSDKLEVRLGGIYALERIARDSQKDHWTVMEVLTAFVRENSHKLLEGQPPETLREDIQAIMTVIGRREWRETERLDINLERVNLNGCKLWKANLSKAYLSEANLNGAYLRDADLSRTNLSMADLNGADLNGANLNKAILFAADLTEADLHRANLNADLREANLNDADLSG